MIFKLHKKISQLALTGLKWYFSFEIGVRKTNFNLQSIQDTITQATSLILFDYLLSAQ